MRTLKKTVFLLLGIMLILISFPSLGVTANHALKITNMNENKDIYQHNGQVLYQKIFTRRDRFKTTEIYHIQENVSTSLTSQLRQQNAQDTLASQAAKQAWTRILDYLKNNVQNALLPTAQAHTFLPKAIMNLPDSLHISPKVKLGKNYVKPSLSIENASLVNTHISYHSRDKYLETEFSRYFSKNLEFILQNTHGFAHNTDEKKITLGLKYRF